MIVNKIKKNISNFKETDVDISGWHKFKISDLFVVHLSRGDNKIKELEKGSIPLVSATSENNGVVGFVKTGDGKSQLFDGKSITVDMFGKAFYHDIDFYSVSHGRVNILIPISDINKYHGLFIVTALKNLTEKYSFSGMCTSKKIEKEEIYLPCIRNDDGTVEPNWKYMEDYIRDIESKIFT